MLKNHSVEGLKNPTCSVDAWTVWYGVCLPFLSLSIELREEMP